MKSLIPLLIFVGLSHSVLAEKPKSFFPTSEGGDKETISLFEEEWYSKHLRLMEQPSLYAKVGDKSADIYRFTLLPTWGDPRCAVVTKRDGKAEIFFARLDGDGGYDPGKLVENAKRELSLQESKKFFTLFDALDFAKQSTDDPVIGVDGSQWILERLKDGKYHIVVRWTADAYEPKTRGTESFVKLCEWMLVTAPQKKSAEQADGGSQIQR